VESVYDQTQDGEKHNPWGDGVKGQAIYDAQGHFSWMIMSANRPKADTSPRIPVGQAIAFWGTYTVNDEAKTLTTHIERSTFPQWNGGGGTVSIAFPTEDEFQYTVTKPLPDPTLGPIVPHLIFKRASTFAQQKEAVDPQIVEQLNANGKKFAEAVNNNDAAAVAALYTEDAVFVTDRGPVHGRQAIEKWWADTFKAVHPKNYIDKTDPSSLRVVGTADTIRVAGEWNETLQGKNGEPIQAKGYWSDILVREGDDWKIQVVWQRGAPRLVRPSLYDTVGSGSGNSPLHHEVSLIGVTCLGGLRGKISIINMRP
jgi:uncharacterized protein (TIGR02246 family)